MAFPVTYSIQRPDHYNRWTVFFRAILVIPQYIVLFGFPFTIFSAAIHDNLGAQFLLVLLSLVSLNTVLVVLVLLTWFAIIFTGHFPARFLRACLSIFRWQQNVFAYLWLLAAPYPPFGTGPYPLRLEVAPAVEHDRVTTLFRIILVIPIYVVIEALGLALFVATFFAWWAILFTGRYPESMYELAAGIARANARLLAYLYLFVDEYPPFSLSDETGAAGLQPQTA